MDRINEPTARKRPSTDGDTGPSRAADRRGLHVGIIMDGNGRWAERRGLPRSAGHRAGVPAVRRTVSAAPGLGIGALTLYAFSSDNWRRPPLEVRHLMHLFRAHLRSEAARCLEEGVRVRVIGRRDRLPTPLVTEIESIEERTRGGRTLDLRLAVDYSSRDAILRAARAAVRVNTEASSEGGPELSHEGFRRLISRSLHAGDPLPDVDVVIRTGGERRLSDFLLWESAYAELVFTRCLWPDFDEERLRAAMEEFAARERRFGGVPERGDVGGPTSSRTAPGARPGPRRLGAVGGELR